MAAQWIFFLSTGNVPELETAPLEIAFHLSAELITALALILAFLLIHRKQRAARLVAAAAQGMLIYTVINSAGYFAQGGEWPLVAVFGMLFCIASLNLGLLMKANNHSRDQR